MNKIKVDQFAILADNLPSEQISLDFTISFGVAPSLHEVCTTVRFELCREDTPLLILELSCYFEIREEDWNQLIEGNRITIPRSLLAHFGVHAIGTARGVLFCKTEGTAFSTFILPPLNVAEKITEDITLELS